MGDLRVHRLVDAREIVGMDDPALAPLRRKLGDASPIVTVWGVGYKVGPTPGDRPSS